MIIKIILLFFVLSYSQNNCLDYLVCASDYSSGFAYNTGESCYIPIAELNGGQVYTANWWVNYAPSCPTCSPDWSYEFECEISDSVVDPSDNQLLIETIQHFEMIIMIALGVLCGLIVVRIFDSAIPND